MLTLQAIDVRIEERVEQAETTSCGSDRSKPTRRQPALPFAHHWGFTNLDRFAAAHAARCGEPPAATLRRPRRYGLAKSVRHAASDG